MSGDGHGLGPMVQGFLDGFHDDRQEWPHTLSNRGHAYRHGWLNGRDDRTGRPRASAASLRLAADLAEEMDQAGIPLKDCGIIGRKTEGKDEQARPG